MIRTNRVTETQIAVRHNGIYLGEFRKMTPGVWVFAPQARTAYTASTLREITDQLSRLGIAGAQV